MPFSPREGDAVAIQRQVLKIAERLTRARIYPAWRINTRGIDLYADMAEHLPAQTWQVVFDVGANVGQSAAAFLREFPSAEIYCFEPVADSFRALCRAVPGVRAFQLALGAARQSSQMVHHGDATMFYLRSAHEAPADVELEDVQVDTTDNFCSTQDIERINFLKIDTEGSDLDVLKGAAEMLTSKRIDVIQVEAGLNCRNTHHVPLEEFKAFLEPKEYFLFGIYECVNEWPTKEPHLRRANLVFISDNVIESNKG